jgi:putative membrane protein
MTDLLLAIAHHLLIFALLGLLAAELASVGAGLSPRRIGLLAGLDRAYGGVAVLILVVGFARVFLGAKSAEFYLLNPMFWAKIAAFLAVGLLSIVPTMRLIAWNRRLRADPAFVPAAGEIAAVRRFLLAEAAVFPLIPIFAAAMARGYGL